MTWHIVQYSSRQQSLTSRHRESLLLEAEKVLLCVVEVQHKCQSYFLHTRFS